MGCIVPRDPKEETPDSYGNTDTERKANRMADDDFNPEEIKGEETAVAAFDSSLIVSPTIAPSLNTGVPKADYILQYVYGYRGYDSRENLFFSSNGSLLYPMAAVGVILDPNTNSQALFGGKALGKTTHQHDDDILCLAVSADRKKVATGQIGVKPKLFIWSSDGGKYISKSVISDKKCKGIVACAFSTNAEHLAFVDISDQRNVYVMNANTGKTIWKKATGNNEIYSISWGSAKEFAICGKNTVRFYNSDTQEENNANGFNGQIMGCITTDANGKYYASSVKGAIYLFNGSEVTNQIPNAHKGKITALIVDGDNIVSIGDDKRITFHNKNTRELVKEISCRHIPRSIDIFKDLMAVGNIQNGITLYKNNKEIKNWWGHHDGEVWGLAVTDNMVYTSGDDNKLIAWNYKNCKAEVVAPISERPGEKTGKGPSTQSKLPDNQCARALSYNKKTEELAIATNNGKIHIRSTLRLSEDKNVIACSEYWIESMEYSPLGEMLAVGTHGNEVVIYDVPSYNLRIKLSGHNSPIISIDWSEDSTYLRTVDEKFNMLFWKGPEFVQDKSGPGNTKDTKWATQNAKIGWSVQGIYPPGVDKFHVNCASKSKDGKLIATGDDWGFVNIYNFPCGRGAKCVSLRGHAEHVPRVAFSKDGTYLFSVGGKDKAVIQWKK